MVLDESHNRSYQYCRQRLRVLFIFERVIRHYTLFLGGQPRQALRFYGQSWRFDFSRERRMLRTSKMCCYFAWLNYASDCAGRRYYHKWSNQMPSTAYAGRLRRNFLCLYGMGVKELDVSGKRFTLEQDFVWFSPSEMHEWLCESIRRLILF